MALFHFFPSIITTSLQNVLISRSQFILTEDGETIKILLAPLSNAAIILTILLPSPISSANIHPFLDNKNLTPSSWWWYNDLLYLAKISLYFLKSTSTFIGSK